MTDRIDFGGEPWQAIPRRILRDPRLSHRAKGGLVTLLSHEEGWVRSAIAILMHEGICGRKQAQAIMAELRRTGYADLLKEREGNLIKSRYVIYAIPKGSTFQPQLVNSSDLPVSGPSRSGSTGKGAAVVDPQDVDPLDVDPRVSKPSAKTSFAEFYAAFPRHMKPRDAETAYKAALKRTNHAAIMAAVERLNADPNLPAKEHIPYPASWLRADGWLNDPYPSSMPSNNGHRPDPPRPMTDGEMTAYIEREMDRG